MIALAEIAKESTHIPCSICGLDVPHHVRNGEVVWATGHNAEPVNDGRCCDWCNENVVIRRRMNDRIRAQKEERS